jgi:hypothetical protein
LLIRTGLGLMVDQNIRQTVPVLSNVYSHQITNERDNWRGGLYIMRFIERVVGLVQQPDKFVVRVALTIYPYSLGQCWISRPVHLFLGSYM